MYIPDEAFLLTKQPDTHHLVNGWGHNRMVVLHGPVNKVKSVKQLDQLGE